MKTSSFFAFFSLVLLITLTACKKSTPENKPSWAKKDIRDYNDADLERLLDQWEVRYLEVSQAIISLNSLFRKTRSLSNPMSFPSTSGLSRKSTSRSST